MCVKPAVSIFLPTHNYGKFIFDSIESIARQTYQNFELILIDNNSEDNTLSIVKGFEPVLQNKLHYKFNSRNLGAEPSINKYLEYSSGDLIAFQAGDDVWLPEKLELQVSAFKKCSTLGLVYSNFFFWDTRNENNSSLKIAHLKSMPSGNILNKLLRGNFIGATTVVTRREVLLEVGGFDEKLDLMGDYATWLKISRLYQVQYIPEPLVKIRIHGNNLSLRKLVKMRTQEMKFIKNFVLTLCKDRIGYLDRMTIIGLSIYRVLKGYLRTIIHFLILRK